MKNDQMHHHSGFMDDGNLVFSDFDSSDFMLSSRIDSSPPNFESRFPKRPGGISADGTTTGTTTASRTVHSTTTISSTDPALSGSPNTVPGSNGTEALYLVNSSDTAAVSLSDIHQGQIGDCFLLSAMGELALTHPTAISSMIQQNANGTETVRLYGAAGGGMPTFGTSSYTPLLTTVSNSFPDFSVNGGGQDVVNGVNEIWAQAIEGAYANLNGGYSTISNGGNPMIPMEELTGQAASWMSPSSLTLSELQSFMAAGDLITMDTPNQSSLPFNLVGGHAYMLEGLTTVNGAPAVQLANPWGFDQPNSIPFSQLSQGIVEVDVGRVA